MAASSVTLTVDERAELAVGHWLSPPGDRAGSDGELVRSLVYVSGADISEAHQLFTDELVEGLLGRNTLAVIYGDSNSGKTFFAIDIAAAVAEDRIWHQRNVAGGIVLYLATEAPGSVQVRVAAYKRQHGGTLRKLIVVKSPINLYEGDADVVAVLALVARIEAELGDRVVLVVGDTLARLSAGANENAGADMGTVLRNADRLREATGACFLLIHHTGKDAAKGMRGWSGMRAAIETEIEVVEDASTGVRTAEVTKQRDLPGKGDRIGFRLEPVVMGRNVWDTERSSCVVVSTEAPARVTKEKPLPASAGAIIEFLAARGTGCRRREVFEHFEGWHSRSAVYKSIGTLLQRGDLIECAGVVALAGKPGPNA